MTEVKREITNIIGILALILLIAAAPAPAHEEDEHESDHHGKSGCLMARFKAETGGFLLAYKKELKLTPDQLDKLKKMSRDLCGRLHDKKEQIRISRAELKQMTAVGNVDVDGYQKKLKKIYDMEYEFKCEAMKEFIKSRQILTPDQLKMVPSLLNKP